MVTQMLKRYSSFVYLLIFLTTSVYVWPDDWPIWGGNSSRNMISHDKEIPHTLDIGETKDGSEEIDLTTTQNIKWAVELGSLAYGNPTVSQGCVLIGTNNETPRDAKHIGDRGVLLCLDESNGSLLWQLLVPKIVDHPDSDLEDLGICSSPTIEDNRVYVVTNRCEVVCLDIKGLSNGNDGPFTDEALYINPKGKPSIALGEKDADIIWVYDMRQELNVYPHNISSSSILVVGDKLFVTTSNGVDEAHKSTPSPNAPCLIALHKETGELLGVEKSGISKRLMHCNWSSPSYGTINQQGIVVFGAGDGYCYGFEPIKRGAEKSLTELWRFNCIPDDYQMKKYFSSKGPSEIIATPVIHDGLVYACIGQDPENGDGAGFLACIDASKRGDITKDGAVWTYKDIRRSISTPSIINGMIFIADFAGFIHCLDAKTGKVHWVHDTQSCIWGSTLFIDGTIYVGNEDGYLYILKADKKNEMIAEIDMGEAIYSSPIVANGVLYITTQTHLYAISK
jgi:outer membrane protein assembly factor BamB